MFLHCDKKYYKLWCCDIFQTNYNPSEIALQKLTDSVRNVTRFIN